jgi:hypothetical protein
MVRIASALLALAASAGLAGCAYGPGYGGVSVGYGAGGYYDDYAPYYGWYDDYYYPGTGYYIYDRGGHRHKWNERHRQYWEGRGHGRDGHEHWGGFGGERRDGDRNWRGRRDGDDRGQWRGRRDGQDGDRRSYRDVRGPQAYSGNAPAQATTGQPHAAPATTARPDTGNRGAWREAQRERRAVSGNQPRAGRGDGGGRPNRGGDRGGEHRGGHGPQG